MSQFAVFPSSWSAPGSFPLWSSNVVGICLVAQAAVKVSRHPLVLHYEMGTPGFIKKN